MSKAILLGFFSWLLLSLINYGDCGKDSTAKFYIWPGHENPSELCTAKQPCGSFKSEIITKAINNKDFEKIEFLVHPGSKDHHNHDFEFKTMVTNKSLSFKCWDRRKMVKIKVTTNTEYLVKLIANSGNSPRTLSFNGFYIRRPLAEVQSNNTKIYLTRCKIENIVRTLIKTDKDKTFKASLFMKQVECRQCDGIASFKSLAKNSVIDITDSTFKNNYVYGFGISVKEITSRIVCNVKNTTFHNFKTPIELHSEKRDCTKKSNVSRFNAKNSKFTSNTKPVNLNGCFVVVIQSTLFENNKEGAVFIKDNKNQTNILTSYFYSNKDNGAVRLENANITNINSTLFHGNKGKEGGAVFAHRSRLYIRNATFQRNAASSGHDIYLKGDDCSRCFLSLINTSIHHFSDEMSSNAYSVYSDKKITIQNSTFRGETGGQILTKQTLKYVRSDEAIYIGGNGTLNYTCPHGYNPHQEEEIKSKPIFTKIKGKRYMNVTAFQFLQCRLCPVDMYSYKPIVKYIRQKNNSIVFQSQSTESKCLPCPDGGNCTQGLISQDNYWGFVASTKDKVSFLACPDSYCCSKDTTKCVSYQTCAKERSGYLCGTCKTPYTQDFFSNLCIKRDKCKPWLYWTMQLACVLLSIYFFMHDSHLIPVKRLFDKIRRKQSSNSRPVSVIYTPRSSSPTSQEPTSHDEPPSTSNLLEISDEMNRESPVVDPLEVLVNTQPLSSSTAEQKQGNGLIDITDQILEGDLEKIFSSNEPSSSQKDEQRSKSKTTLNRTLSGSEEVVYQKDSSTDKNKGDVDIGLPDDNENFDPFSKEYKQRNSPTDEKPSTSAATEDDDVTMIEDVVSIKELYKPIYTKIDQECMIFFIGMMKIFFFYNQASKIIHSRLKQESKALSWFTNTFIFQPIIFPSTYLCPFKSMDRLTKDWLTILNLLSMILLPIVFYTGRSFFRYMKNKLKKPREFDFRVKRVALDLLTLSYPLIASTCFSMVTCVNIGGENRVYYQGDEKCMTKSQSLVIFFIIYWVVPLPLAVYGAGQFLQNEQITLNQFYGILFAPLYALYCLYEVRKRKWKPKPLPTTDDREMEEVEIKHVLRGFYGPFKREGEQNHPINWQSVILGRGLLLSLCNVIIPNYGAKSLITLALLTGFIVHQWLRKPYNMPKLNILALSFLFGLLFINIAAITSAFSYKFVLNKKSPLLSLESLLWWLHTGLVIIPDSALFITFGVSLFVFIKDKLNQFITRCNTGKKYGSEFRQSDVIQA